MLVLLLLAAGMLLLSLLLLLLLLLFTMWLCTLMSIPCKFILHANAHAHI